MENQNKINDFLKSQKAYLKRLDEHYDKMPASCKMCVNKNNVDVVCKNCEHKANRDKWAADFDYQEDKLIFEKTKYKDMNFTRLSDWDNLGSYTKFAASPTFVFENGDKVYFDKKGNLVVL